MTKEEIIRMAIEAELIYNEEGWCGWVEDTDLRPFIERFAALVAAAERKRFAWTHAHWTEYERNITAAAKAEEREACALLSEEYVCGNKASIEQDFIAESIAADIRARGETK